MSQVVLHDLNRHSRTARPAGQRMRGMRVAQPMRRRPDEARRLFGSQFLSSDIHRAFDRFVQAGRRPSRRTLLTRFKSRKNGHTLVVGPQDSRFPTVPPEFGLRFVDEFSRNRHLPHAHTFAHHRQHPAGSRSTIWRLIIDQLEIATSCIGDFSKAQPGGIEPLHRATQPTSGFVQRVSFELGAQVIPGFEAKATLNK